MLFFWQQEKSNLYLPQQEQKNEIRSQHMYEMLFASLPKATRMYMPGKNVMI